MKSIFIFLLFSLPLATAAQDSLSRQKTPFILGTVETIHSKILGEDRFLNIYLPENYNRDLKYPVIYLLDGSADEDFIHVVGIVQFNTLSWINRIPKSIVVGIVNTQRKFDFTSPSNRASDNELIPKNGGSDKFIAFIEKELQPFVDQHYATDHTKTIIGQSLGGLLATEILFTKPQLFDKYIIISPSLWWRDGALLSSQPNILSKRFRQPIGIYIGVGKEGSIDGSKTHIMEQDARLLYEKIEKGSAGAVKVNFDYLPDEDHATITHQAIFNAFRILYPKK